MKIKDVKVTYGAIQWFLSCFIILWLNGGNFEYIQGLFPQVVKFGLVFLWFWITTLVYQDFFRLYLSRATPILLMIAVIFAAQSMGNGRYFRLYWMNYLYYAILFAVFVCSFYFYSERQNKALLVVFLADVAVVAVHTFIEVMNNPLLVRILSTGGGHKRLAEMGLIPTGLGGYGMCYQLVFVSMLLMLLLDEKIQHRLLVYLAQVLIFLVLFSAQITLAMIMQVVGVAAVLMIRNDRRSWVWKTVLLTVLALALLNFDSILEYIISFAGEDMAVRLEELMRIREISIESDGDLAARYRLYWQSFSLFLENPIWGDFGGEGIGCHSTFLDLLGAFGLMGILGIVGFLRPLRMTWRACESGGARRDLLAFFFLMVVLATINVSVGSDIMLATTVALPLFFRLRYLREDNDEDY